MNHNIGQGFKRIDGAEKVSGAAIFTEDRAFQGMLYCKVLRSPHAHALIKNIDVRAAVNSCGVVRVLTGEDVPGPFGVAIKDQYPIAFGKVRYAGEPVAAVIAESEKSAQSALKLIRVEYEPLPFTLNPKKAADKDAPILHDELMSYEAAPYVVREGGNVFQHLKVRKGDVNGAFEKAYRIVEGDYAFPLAHHVQLEPHCAIARYTMDDSMEMYASTQAPFVVQECISHLHSIPLHKVRVVSSYLGGGFGGKSDITIEALTSCAAKAVPGRYVRLLLTREEMFSGSSLGRGSCCHYRLGFDKSGLLTAMKGVGYLSGGGNADYAVNIATGMANAGTGPYEVKNLCLDMFGVYTNTPPIGAMRGYGHPEVHMPVEMLFDKAAKELGVDAVVLRQKNLLAPGKVNGIGQVMKKHNGDVIECVNRVSAALASKPKPKNNDKLAFGRGVTAYMKAPCMPSNVQAGALIKLNADGTVTVAIGAIEMGQGTYTALAQIAAQALDLPFEKVNMVRQTDTLISPYDWQTVASHTTWASGNAIIIAADDLKEKLKAEAAKIFKTTADKIELSDSKAICGGKEMNWSEFALGYRKPDGAALTKPVIGEGYFVAHNVQNPDPETGQGNAAADWTFGSVGVELSIEKATGEVTLLRLVNAIDAGTIINPQIARDQVIGGMIMAAGSALCETLVFSDDLGGIRNGNLVDYKVFGLEDLPLETEIIFVETPEDSGPYGAKGIGEHGAVGVVPAILNAINDAIGVEFSTLPVSAEKIIAAKAGEKDA